MPALPEGIRVALDLHLDWRVVIYTIAFSTITGILFGLAPALHSSKADVSTVLKDDSSLFTGFYRKSRARMALVVVQVAFSLLLLVGAGLVLRSLEKDQTNAFGLQHGEHGRRAGEVGRSEIRSSSRARSFSAQLSERAALLCRVCNRRAWSTTCREVSWVAAATQHRNRGLSAGCKRGHAN